MNRRRSGYVTLSIIAVVVVAGILMFLFRDNLFNSGGRASNSYVMTNPVVKGDLLVTVTEDGTLESAANVEVKCQVAGGSSILWIIDDGTYVEEGEKIVELDASALEDQIISQQNALETAKATKIQAENDYAVAKISVKEYEEGNFKKELQEAETEITIALENLRNAQNSLEHSQKMFRKGYLSKLELESQEFAVKRSQLELDSANSAKDVLVKYTKAKMLEDLQSKVATAEAKMNSELRSFELEQSKLEKLVAQKDNCVIYAPQRGMVVYANSKSRWGQQQAQIEEGAVVRERQAIIKLPDLTKMQVNVKVHESKVEMLKPGMRAVVRVQGKELQGTVEFVANQPEQGGFMSAKVQEYSTIIRIDGEQEGLKPGMTAEATILVTHEKGILKAPVAAVVEKGGKYYAWVDESNGFDKRELILGASDENFVVVKDGLVEDEELVINPRAVIQEARGDNDSETGSDSEDASKFGDTSDVPQVDPTKGPTQTKSKKGSPRGGSATGPKGGSGRSGGGKGYGKKGGGGGSFDASAIFDRMDADGDGVLKDDEISSRMKDRVKDIDTDGDGAISKDEWNESMKKWSRAK